MRDTAPSPSESSVAASLRGPARRVVRRRAGFALASVLGAAFMLATMSEGGAAADVGDAGKSSNPKAGIPPDPPALSERVQWVFDLRWERGEVYLVQIHKTDMGKPHPTPRMMGRFALELYEGPTLIERARFDFPMLGAYEEPDGGWKAPPRWEPKLKTRIGVLFPATKRGTRLELWDRASDRRWPLPWPPQEGVFRDPSAPDAGR